MFNHTHTPSLNEMIVLFIFKLQEKCITHKVNTFDVIQQKSLNSKFMHYSIANSSNSDNNNQLPNTVLPSRPSLVSF